MTDPADTDAAAPDTAPMPIVGAGPVEASRRGDPSTGEPADRTETPGSAGSGSAGDPVDPSASPNGTEPEEEQVTTGTRRRAAGPGVVQNGSAAPNGSAVRNGGAARRGRPSRSERRGRVGSADPGQGVVPAAPAAAPPASTVTEVGVDDLLDEVEQGSAVEGFTPTAFSPRPAAEPTRTAEPEPQLVGQPALVGTPARRRGGARTGTIGAPSRTQVAAARRLQARKVGRLVRHVELWSLLKVALIFYLCMLVVGTIAGVIIWSALQRAGAVSSIEGFIESVFLVEDFRFEGGDIFRIGVLGGMVGVLVLTLLTVLAGGLFNLISDLTGGVRVSVVQLESARPVPARRRR